MEKRRLKAVATGRGRGRKALFFFLVYLHKYTEFACYYVPLE